VGILQHGCGKNGLHRTHADVVAKRYRAQKMSPIDAKLFTHCQRGRDDRTAWMGASSADVVIGFIRLSQRAVYNCGFDRSA
jgi:hypothetical protein